MKPKNLIILAAVLVVLVGFSMFQSRNKESVFDDGEFRIGDKVFANLDINEVAHVKLVSKGGTNTVTLARGKEKWVVKSLFDYPADFSKIRDNLRKIVELKVGQVIHGGADDLEELELKSDKAMVITLANASNSPLTTLRIGKSRKKDSGGAYGGYADGQFVMVGDEGLVLLVDENLSYFPDENGDWIDKKLLDINSTDIEEVKVSHAKDGQGYTLEMEGSDSYKLDGLAEGEEIDTGNAGRVKRALQSLYCTTVADPATKDEETGFDKATIYTAKTKEGLVYEVTAGKELEDDGGHYLRIKVVYNKPAAPSRADVAAEIADEMKLEEENKKKSGDSKGEGKDDDDSKTDEPSAEPEKDLEQIKKERVDKEMQKRMKEYRETIKKNGKIVKEQNQSLANWTYVVSSYSGEAFGYTREKLIKKPEPKEEEKQEDTETKSDESADSSESADEKKPDEAGNKEKMSSEDGDQSAPAPGAEATPKAEEAQASDESAGDVKTGKSDKITDTPPTEISILPTPSATTPKDLISPKSTASEARPATIELPSIDDTAKPGAVKTDKSSTKGDDEGDPAPPAKETDSKSSPAAGDKSK